ncbi:MAG: hypothetical protein M1832_001668 [Thelocarpon impressellum]|nr:MAG: hypothetical protein M1832_001668 [Thelocarpon impressellum]
MAVSLPNGGNPGLAAAQFAAMQGNPALRPVQLPQHMQQQQLAAQQQQQQQQQQHQQQQQQMLAQHIAMQQANAAAHANSQGPQGQPGPQQPSQGVQNAQALAAAQQQQQQQQQHQQQQQQAAQQQAASAMMQPRGQITLKGTFVLQMLQFGDHLGQFTVSPTDQKEDGLFTHAYGAAQAAKKQSDLLYWQRFVDKFFSHAGVSRQQLWHSSDHSSKQYEISTPALPRYYCTHFESGVRNIQMILENAREKELPNNCHHVESPKASFIYWFENGTQVISSGTLRAQFDQNSKIDVLEFVTQDHKEFLPRNQMKALVSPHNSPDQKMSSPKQTKTLGKQKAQQRALPPPPIVLPESQVNDYGVTDAVTKFLELAETISQMQPLFSFSQQNSHLSPFDALAQLVTNFQSASGAAGSGPANAPQNAFNSQQQLHQGPGGLPNSLMGNQFPLSASPSMAHLNLPGSPHVGSQPSPAQSSMQAPGLMAQHSQQGTNSSQGNSVSTSPNVQNKRRRPSGVKAEGDEGGGVGVEVNGTSGTAAKVKASPRVGGKRQKGNPA